MQNQDDKNKRKTKLLIIMLILIIVVLFVAIVYEFVVIKRYEGQLNLSVKVLNNFKNLINL